MSKKKNNELRQVLVCEWLRENYIQHGHLRYDVVSDRLQIRNLDSLDSCRMVQNRVESSSIENTMLHNSTQPLNNATQPLHNATQPLNNATAHRTGIRIHAGNTIEHTTGCILVGDLAGLVNASLQYRERSQASYSLESREICLRNSRKRLEELRNYLLNYIKQNPYEEIYIQLESPDPYPDADTPCNYEQQQHIQESLQRAHRLREERRGGDEVMRL